jgi:uncharacterized membrane protein
MTPTTAEIAKILYEMMPMARREQVMNTAIQIQNLIIQSQPKQSNEKSKHLNTAH